MSNTVVGKSARVIDALDRAIHAGELKRGDRLEGEFTLARRFNVSRGTIRQALRELQERDLVATHPGIGSFVTFDDVPLDQTIGWAQALRLAREDIITDVISLTLADWDDLSLPACTADEGKIAADQAVVIKRLRRLAEGAPVSYEVSCVPAIDALLDLPERGLVSGSIWATLRPVGMVPVSGRQQVQLERLKVTDATLLARPEGAPFLRTDRTSYGAEGRLVEHVTALLDPDHFHVVVDFGESR